jgi:hypothetical protein
VSVLVVVGVLFLGGHVSAAYGQPGQPPGADGSIIVTPGDQHGIFGAPSVDVGAQSLGGPTVAGAASSGARTVPCTLVQQPDEVARRTWESGHTGPMPAGFRVILQGCGGLPLSFFTTTAGAGPGPELLAQQAAAQLVLPLPLPRHSPDLRLADGRAAVVVGEPTWVWTEPTSFAPLSRRVDAGPVWTQVTARPVGLEFDPGDSGPVVGCAGPGTPFDRTRHGLHEPSPDCGFVYAHSSLGQPGDQVTATYAIRWQVSWVGATAAGPAQGVLPELVSRATSSFVVAEAQSLRTQ